MIPLWVVVLVCSAMLARKLGKSRGPFDSLSGVVGCAVFLLGVIVTMFVWYFTRESVSQ